MDDFEEALPKTLKKDHIFAIERGLLAHCFVDPTIVVRLAPVLNDFVFTSTDRKWLWDTIYESYTTHRELPDPETWEALIASEFPSEEDRDSIIDTITDAEDLAVKSPRRAIAELKKWARVAAIFDVTSSISTEFANQAPSREMTDAAEKRLDKLRTRLAAIKADSEVVDWASSFEERLTRTMDGSAAERRIKLPIEAFNQFTNGGLPPGHVVMIRANTNVGKSTNIASFGGHALLNGSIVIHIAVEELDEELLARYDAYMTEIDRGSFSAGTLTENEQERARQWAKRNKATYANRLYLKSVPMRTRFDVVLPIIEEARRRDASRPILLLVDSPDNLISGNRYEQPRFDIRDVWEGYKGLAMTRELWPLSIILTTQAQAKHEGKRIKGNNASAESVDKDRISSFTINILDKGAPDGMPEEVHDIEYTVTKNRIWKINRRIVDARLNYSTGRMKQVGKDRRLADEVEE